MSPEIHNHNCFSSSKILKAFNYKLQFIVAIFFSKRMYIYINVYIYIYIYCRHHILYLLQLGSLFPNDTEILKPKIGLRPNQMLN